MLISSLVLTLADEPAPRAAAIARLRAHPALELGEVNDRWLPAAMEAADDRESRALHDWIGALPGVVFVDVVAVHFDDPATASAHVD